MLVQVVEVHIHQLGLLIVALEVLVEVLQVTLVDKLLNKLVMNQTQIVLLEVAETKNKVVKVQQHLEAQLKMVVSL